jgi:hypothetical protein
VLAARRAGQAAFADAHFKRDALCGVERCAGELVTEMLSLVESVPPPAPAALAALPPHHHVGLGNPMQCVADHVAMRLTLDTFPVFNDLFLQLRAADPEYARHCLLHYKDFLGGPPNRRTPDRYGLLHRCLDTLDRCGNGTYAPAPGAMVGGNAGGGDGGGFVLGQAHNRFDAAAPDGDY